MKNKTAKTLSLSVAMTILTGCTHVNDYLSDIAFETKEAARELYREKVQGYDDSEDRRTSKDEKNFYKVKNLSFYGEKGLAIARKGRLLIKEEHWGTAADLMLTMGQHYENPDVQEVQDMEARVVEMIDTIHRDVDRTVILLVLLEYQVWRNDNPEKIENTLTKCHEAVQNMKGIRRLETGNRLREVERDYRRSSQT